MAVLAECCVCCSEELCLGRARGLEMRVVAGCALKCVYHAGVLEHRVRCTGNITGKVRKTCYAGIVDGKADAGDSAVYTITSNRELKADRVVVLEVLAHLR